MKMWEKVWGGACDKMWVGTWEKEWEAVLGVRRCSRR